MSTYETLRHFADSYGLMFMAFVFLGFIAWTFRRGAHRDHRRAATMIFDEDRSDG